MMPCGRRYDFLTDVKCALNQISNNVIYLILCTANAWRAALAFGTSRTATGARAQSLQRPPVCRRCTHLALSHNMKRASAMPSSLPLPSPSSTAATRHPFQNLQTTSSGRARCQHRARDRKAETQAPQPTRAGDHPNVIPCACHGRQGRFEQSVTVSRTLCHRGVVAGRFIGRPRLGML